MSGGYVPAIEPPASADRAPKSGLGDGLETFDGLADLLCKLDEGGNDSSVGKRLTFAKDYIEGRINVLATFRDPARPSLMPVCEFRCRPRDDWSADPSHPGKDDWGSRWIEATQIKHIDRQGTQRRADDPMLVQDVEVMKQYEIISLPSWVGFYLVNCFDELWSGELYLSVRDGTHKSVRRCGKWELDSLGGWRVVGGNECPNDVIQGGMKIVDRISDAQTDGALKGFVTLDKYASITGLGIVHNDDAPPAAAERCPLPFNIVDVMFGPL